MNKSWSVACLLMFLTGCGQPMFDNERQKLVRAGLKDPESAKWVAEVIYKDKACIVFNAKNSFGGYTGNQSAWLSSLRNATDWALERIDDRPCAERTLQEWFQKVEDKRNFEKTVIKILKDKQLSATPPEGLLFIPRPSDNGCLELARSAVSSYSLAHSDEGQKSHWESKMNEELTQLRAGQCQH